MNWLRRKRTTPVRAIVPWNDPGLAQITLLRLTGPKGFGWLTVERCVGVMKSGEVVAVTLPMHELPRRGTIKGTPGYYGALLDWARRDGVYLEGLGVFNKAVIVVVNQED